MTRRRTDSLIASRAIAHTRRGDVLNSSEKPLTTTLIGDVARLERSVAHERDQKPEDQREDRRAPQPVSAKRNSALSETRAARSMDSRAARLKKEEVPVREPSIS